MPEQAVHVPDEGTVVRLEDTPATEDARKHGDRFTVVETRFRQRPSATGGYATRFTTIVTPKGEDAPHLKVPTETLITD